MPNSLFDIEFSFTGFGKFANVLRNPTSDLVGQIRQLLTVQQIKVGLTQVIKVAAEDVEAQLLGIYSCLDIRQQENSNFKQCLIHLGVDSSSSVISLEKFGINQAVFGASGDERQYTPQKLAIN